MGRSKLPARTDWHALAPGAAAAGSVRFTQELEALGAQIIVAQVDVTDEPALAGWLAGFRTLGYPPLRGVFHTAGQVRDTLVTQMDRETFDAVYDPKVVGSYLLHKHTAGEPLEHFVLFSSIASLMTTAGQTNYRRGQCVPRRPRSAPSLRWPAGAQRELGPLGDRHDRGARAHRSLPQ